MPLQSERSMVERVSRALPEEVWEASVWIERPRDGGVGVYSTWKTGDIDGADRRRIIERVLEIVERERQWESTLVKDDEDEEGPEIELDTRRYLWSRKGGRSK